MVSPCTKVVCPTTFISQDKHFFVQLRPTGWPPEFGLVIAYLAFYINTFFYILLPICSTINIFINIKAMLDFFCSSLSILENLGWDPLYHLCILLCMLFCNFKPYRSILNLFTKSHLSFQRSSLFWACLKHIFLHGYTLLQRIAIYTE